MRIVVGHDNEGQWWWKAVGDDGTVVATSVVHASRPECLRSIAELKIEGPAAPVAYDESADAMPFGRLGA